MHNAAYAALGLDWAYVPLPVPPERVGDAVRGLAALGFAGANVTVPHKQAVTPFLDELTPVARAVGAVNTIVVRPDGWLLGDNTDAAGFMADLRAHDVRVGESTNQRVYRSNIKDLRVPASPCPRVLVIGAGGAARAVVYALAEAGATVAVANRTLDKAQELCQTIGAALKFTEPTPQPPPTHSASLRGQVYEGRGDLLPPLLAGEGGRGVRFPSAQGPAERLSAHPFPSALPELAAAADLIVNTTSLGLHADDPLPWDTSVAFRPGQVVYDLIYNRPTELLALARAQGATALDGLGMLVHQGARSAALWTGKNADEFVRPMQKELLTR